MTAPALLLTPTEARVLASLVEKSITTPQYYPMTVNAVMLAANQKNSRHPPMSLNEGEVGAALNRLEQDKLAARDDHAGRVPKWRQRLQHQLLLKPHTLGILTALILRGPQTLAELRANAAPLGGPATDSEALAAIDDLADRAQALAMLLQRASGQKEARYAHLLCGEAAAIAAQPPAREDANAASAATPPRPAVLDSALQETVRLLEVRVAELERRLSEMT